MWNKFTPSILKVNIQWIYSLNTSTMCPFAHVPHHPCLPSRSMHYYINVPHHPAPYTHVLHCSCTLLPMWPITHPYVCLEGGYATLPICPISNMSNDDKMSKSQTHGLWRRFTKKLTYWHHFWCHIYLVNKNPQNVHRKYFWPNLVTFIYLTSKLT